MISGAIAGLFAGFGGSAFVTASKAADLVCIGYFAAGCASSFAGGFMGNFTGQYVTSKIDNVEFDKERAVKSSLFAGAFNIINGYAAAMSTVAAKNALVVGSTLDSVVASRMLTITTIGIGECIYDLLSLITNKIKEYFE